MLLSERVAGNQSPLRPLMSGHMIPQDRTAPKSKDKLTMWGQIIPAPMYVILKSK